MATNFIHRIILVVPAARVAAFNTWVRNNLDAAGADWLAASLSVLGSAPATHALCNAALVPADCLKVLRRLCTLAAVTPPADFDTYTRAQKKQWVVDSRAAIRAATGIRVFLADNDGAWDSVGDVLSAAGLQRILPAFP
jgi:hypothetical protein